MTTKINESQNKSKVLTGAFVLEALKRLTKALKDDENSRKSAPHLSHYREIPEPVKKAYDLLHQGATTVHATSTKYTLVGKVSPDDQKKIATDLLHGCELIGAATHVFLQDASGCSRAVRYSTLRVTLSILVNVTQLVESFEDLSAMKDNIGAQKTGAVWQSCDTILNKMLPQGNRNAIRRELFTWTRDSQDTMEEFQELIDQGPSTTDVGHSTTGTKEEDNTHDFFDVMDDQYSEAELPIASACLGLVKCSRGSMKMTLEACEDLGKKISNTADDERQKYLDSISKLHDKAKAVGDGVTDLGSQMYPPLLRSLDNLKEQVSRQANDIMALQEFVLSLDCGLPSNVSELATKLRKAAETRRDEALESIESG